MLDEGMPTVETLKQFLEAFNRHEVIEFECEEPIILSLRVARSFRRTPTGRLSRSR